LASGPSSGDGCRETPAEAVFTVCRARLYPEWRSALVLGLPRPAPRIGSGYAVQVRREAAISSTSTRAVLRSNYDTDDNPIHTLDTICAGDRHVFPVRQAEGDAIF
jgi:hypothetical protein